MGKAILERFEDKEFTYGVNYKDSIKEDTETRLEQELTGIRPEYLKSFPSLYGKETVRIVSQGQVDTDDLRNNVVDNVTNGLNKLGNIGNKIGGALQTVNNSLFNDGKLLHPSDLLVDPNSDELKTKFQFYATKDYENLIPNRIDRNIVEFRDGITNLNSIVPNAKALALNSAKDAVRGKIGGFIKDKVPAIANSINQSPNDPNSPESSKVIYGPNVGDKIPYTSTINLTSVEDESERNLLKYRSRSPADIPRAGDILSTGTGTNGIKRAYEYDDGTSENPVGLLTSPERTYTKQPDVISRTHSFKYGITNESDKVNLLGVGDRNLDLKIDDESPDKKQMIPFKIENAANGQYAYFRAAITSFNESITPSWDSNRFVGNPFTLFSYNGVERSVSFNLKMFSYNFAEHQKMWERIKFLTSLAYPADYYSNSNAVISPFIKLTIGDMYRDRRGFIESIQYTVDDATTWETDNYAGNDYNLLYDDDGNLTVSDSNSTPDGDGFRLPHIVDVALSIKIIEQRATTNFSSIGEDGYKRRLYQFKEIGRTSNVGREQLDGLDLPLQQKEVQAVSNIDKKPETPNLFEDLNSSQKNTNPNSRQNVSRDRSRELAKRERNRNRRGR